MPKYNLLNGVRILDISIALSGPFAMQIMADLGAEVIKIEAPMVGDLTRDTVPKAGEKDGYYFISLNRNKKSLAVDLQTKSGYEAFNGLVKISDVVFSNLRAKPLDHLGITFENLCKINRTIIFCCLTAFGKGGPYADYPAFDDVVQAMSGISSMTTDDAGAPVRTAVGSSDISAAMYCVVGILSALYRRQKTGQGMEINASMLASSMSFIPQLFQYYFAGKKLPPRMGTKHPAIAGFGFFRTMDGWIALGPCWSRIARVINKEELIDDPRFNDTMNRYFHKEELNAEIQAFFSQYNSEDLLNILRAEDIPAGPVHDLKQIETDPQVVYSNIIRNIKDISRGDLTIVDNPISVCGLPEEEHLPPPLLGQHTEELLGGLLHYSPEHIQRIRREAEDHSTELIDKSVRRKVV